MATNETPAVPTLRVIGAGFGRTGTLSTKMALEQLGLPCYHMLEVFKLGTEHVRFWEDAAERRDASPPQPIDFSLLPAAGYRACVDWPASTFYREMMEQFPDAKVLLTVRDAERWHASVVSSIFPPAAWYLHDRAWYDRLAMWCSRFTLPTMLPIVSMIDRVVWTGHFGGVDLRTEQGKQVAIAEYERHVAEVRRVVPPERLVEFHASQGWAPLCAALDLPVPDVPFPNVNSSAEMSRNHVLIRTYLYVSPFLALGALVGAAYAAHRYVPWVTLGRRLSSLLPSSN